MREISFEETKKIELEILKNVAAFCEKQNLQYFLAYGTLIGAVRHKGFIPWDDDIDLQMPRADYDRFTVLFNREMTGTPYRAIHPKDKAAKHSFIKVIDTRTVKKEVGFRYKKGEYLGIDIDIFPLDGQPEDEAVYLNYFEEKQKLYKQHFSLLYYGTTKRESCVRKAVRECKRCIRKIQGKESFLTKAEKITALYSYEESKFVGSTDSLYNLKKDRMLREYYRDFALLEFEGEKFRAPVDYDAVLTKIYGDYMQLPPEEKRITHHENVMYWKEGKK